MEDRIVTYPLDAVKELADKLQEDDWSLPRSEAVEKARWIVIDVTRAVDRLRAMEAEEK